MTKLDAAADPRLIPLDASFGYGLDEMPQIFNVLVETWPRGTASLFAYEFQRYEPGTRTGKCRSG